MTGIKYLYVLEEFVGYLVGGIKHLVKNAEGDRPLQRLCQEEPILVGKEGPRNCEAQSVVIDKTDQIILFAHDSQYNFMCIKVVVRANLQRILILQQEKAVDDLIPFEVRHVAVMKSLKFQMNDLKNN